MALGDLPSPLERCPAGSRAGRAPWGQHLPAAFADFVSRSCVKGGGEEGEMPVIFVPLHKPVAVNAPF